VEASSLVNPKKPRGRANHADAGQNAGKEIVPAKKGGRLLAGQKRKQ
jgi:hypothetical protein